MTIPIDYQFFLFFFHVNLQQNEWDWLVIFIDKTSGISSGFLVLYTMTSSVERTSRHYINHCLLFFPYFVFEGKSTMIWSK